MTRPIDTIMQTEMTRKEFMATLSLGLASIMGLSTLIHLFTGKSIGSRLHHYAHGEGSSVYGGGGDGRASSTPTKI